jgi:hypothetical protein
VIPTRSLLRAGVVACAVFVAPSIGRAQSPSEIAQAKKWFEEGTKAEEAGDCLAAVERFRKALDVKETPQIHLRVGRCEEKLGRLGAAANAASRAMDLARGNADVLGVARAQFDAVSAKVPKLRVTVSAEDEPIEQLAVELDGKPIEVGTEVLVDPAEHVVRATAKGRAAVSETFRLAIGETKSVALQLGESTASSAGRRSPWPFVLLGVAGASLGASIGLGVSGAGVKASAYEDLAGPAGCEPAPDGGAPRCPPEYEDPTTRPNSPEVNAFFDEVDAANTQFAASIALGTVSAITLAVGITWLVSDDPEQDAAPAESAGKRGSFSLEVAAPFAMPSGGGLVVGGRFD